MPHLRVVCLQILDGFAQIDGRGSFEGFRDALVRWLVRVAPTVRWLRLAVRSVGPDASSNTVALLLPHLPRDLVHASLGFTEDLCSYILWQPLCVVAFQYQWFQRQVDAECIRELMGQTPERMDH